MEIYLLRHGECFESSAEYYCEKRKLMNPPLTQKGIEQAYKLAHKLRSVEFGSIYASDLDRAIQTAEILMAANKSDISDIIVTAQFREIDMGELNLKSWNVFPELYAKWSLHESDLPYPNGECGSDVWNRCKCKIDEVLELGYERIAIVCHGGTIRSIICGILGIPQQKRFQLGAPLYNCSISVVRYQKDCSALLTFNDYCHLDEKT